ncbi:hypothetical protein SEUCBS140593_002055 [Sporothrix eucalyptigena]|uniref:Xylanolytic transcriptional activator regulatory domain-containing protein n=1 Tax=Sporothrix eucalyptigena TaxID=1812306 RepID=A0ABP0B3I6_9PEZI
MLCLAFQYGEDPDRSYDERSGTILSVRCYHRSRALIALAEDNSSSLNDSSRIRAMVQTYLLLEIFAMFYLPSKGSNNGYSSGTDIAPTDMCHVQSPLKSNGNEPAQTSTDGTAMHARLIALARVGGLMQPLPVQATPTHDLHSLWMQFVRNESHKRTLFAVHQLDALWYQLLSIPRSISHLEIKHELPCPEDYWIAPSADQWAHRKLMSGSIRGTGDRFPVSYAEAVRRFLSSDGETDVVLPPFDAYGAINIAQFLISSAREISGWSTITGVLSLERLQPLKSSLIALSPAIHPESETSKATHAGLMCEAIWEIAMIELQLWSPAHTDGIVRGSIEDLLRQSTQLPPPLSRFLYETTTIQPHIDWFLQYLEASVSLNLEAPWIPLYAYKAFLIAYQLVCEGIPGSMRVVGVQDSDVEGALLWAKKVFHRRRHWHLGQVILDCLSKLDKPEI